MMSINDLEIKNHPNDIDFIHEYKKKMKIFINFPIYMLLMLTHLMQ